jgi:hypothetical protein
MPRSPFGRIRVFSAVFACGVGVGMGLVKAFNAARPSASASPGPTAEQVTPIERALERPVPQVWIENQSLKAAAAILSAASGVRIRVEHDPPRMASVDPSEAVTIRLRAVPLMDVLDELARSVGTWWYVAVDEVSLVIARRQRQ